MQSFINAVRNLIVSVQSRGTTSADGNLYTDIETCEEQIRLAGLLNKEHGINCSIWPTRTGYIFTVMFAKDGKVTGASVTIPDQDLRQTLDKKACFISYLEELTHRLKAS